MIPSDWQLPLRLQERLGTEAGPQRSMWEEGHLLLILHALPKPGDSRRTGAFFWRTPDEVWKGADGDGLAGLTAHFNTFEQALADLSAAEAKASSAREYHDVLTVLAPITRTVRHAHEVMQKARETLPEEERLIDLRDRSAALERAAELLLQDANYGLNFTVARRSEEEAEAARRLNILAAIFLPLTTLTGVFSMSMQSRTGFEAQPDSFWIVVAAGLGVGLLAAWMLGRRK